MTDKKKNYAQKKIHNFMLIFLDLRDPNQPIFEA